MAETTDTPVLDLLADMTAASIEASPLDAETLMLVRIAALVAVDAPPSSYVFNLGAAADLDIDVDTVRGVLAAVAPIVGSAPIVSALSNIAMALEVAIDLVEAQRRGRGDELSYCGAAGRNNRAGYASMHGPVRPPPRVNWAAPTRLPRRGNPKCR